MFQFGNERKMNDDEYGLTKKWLSDSILSETAYTQVEKIMLRFL
jgi:hypothetical protein